MGFSLADGAVSGLSLLTLAGVVYIVKDAFKKHHMNVFAFLMISLVIFGLISKLSVSTNRLLVRALFFISNWDELVYSSPDDPNSNTRVLALIWTYPLLNFILVSYTCNSRWVYDLMMLMTNNRHPRLLRR